MNQTASQVVSRDERVQALSVEQIEQARRSFAEEGYAILRGVVSKERLAALRARLLDEYAHASSAGGLFAGGGLISGHLNCFPGEEARFIYDAIDQSGIVQLVGLLAPGLPGGPNVGCNFNLPGSVEQHYHADGAFLQGFIIVNVAVVDTDVANGAIDVLPGTHKRFYKYWRFALEDLPRLSRRLPMQQGDVLVRSSNLWHRGMPNRTDVARPMVAVTFGENRDPKAPATDPFAFNDGKVVFRPNWYRPNFLGRLRERTFVAAPFTYGTYRFVRSLFGNKGYETP